LRFIRERPTQPMRAAMEIAIKALSIKDVLFSPFPIRQQV
jgi:hypothetical protein